MPRETNIEIVERYFDTVWNRGEVHREHEFVADNVVVHTPPGPDVSMLRAALPNLKLRNTALFGEGDRVVQRWMVEGTHTGAPLYGVPSHGESVTVTGISEFRIENGRIQERWGVADVLGVLQQIGAVPDPTHSQPPEK